MAFNPGVQDQRGMMWMQGLSKMGDTIGQGIQQYAANKRQDSALTGLIEGYDPAKLTTLGTKMKPEGQKALEKFLTGKATLNDKTLLAGALQAASKIEADEQEKQMRALQMQEAQRMAAERQRAMAEQEAQRERLRALSQFMGGVGGGVLRPEVQAQMQRQAQNPAMVAAANTQQATGQIPSDEAMMRFMAQQQAATARQPTPMPLSTLQSQFPADKYDSTMVPVPGQPGMVNVKSVSPRAPGSSEPKMVPAGNAVMVYDRDGKLIRRDDVGSAVPSGYEKTPEGGLKPIAGGPAEAEQAKATAEAKAAQEQQKAKALAMTTQLDVMLNAIDETLPRIGGATAGVGALLSSVPGTPAYDMAAKLDTLKANIGFQQLAQMRQASPTGGALGQVAVKELEFLQAALGNLDKWQSPDQLKSNLEKIRTHLTRWQKTVQGINPDDEPEAPKKSGSAGWSTDKEKRLQELRAKLGKGR